MQEVVGSIQAPGDVRKGKTNRNGRRDKTDKECIAPHRGEAGSPAHQAIAGHLRRKEGGNNFVHPRVWAVQEGNTHRGLEEAFHSTVWMGRRLDPVCIRLVVVPCHLEISWQAHY